jgi:hypothetical protein
MLRWVGGYLQLIRVRGPTGQTRVDLTGDSAVAELFEKVATQLKITEQFSLARAASRGCSATEVSLGGATKTLGEIGLA